MDNTSPYSREKLESQTSSEAVKPLPKKPEGLKEVKKTAEKVLRAETAEAYEGQEGAEFSEGKVSESASEDKTHAPQTGASSYSVDQIEAIRAKLLAALPPQEIMIKQIKKTLHRREKILTERMKKLQKKSHLHAFHLNIIVAQLRRIREYFSMLAHATYELIKHLWLKIVHGV